MQQSHAEEDRGGGAGAVGAGAELDETPERSLTTEAVSEAKSFAPSSAASAGATCALYRADEPPSSRPKKPRRTPAAARCRWSCCVSAATAAKVSSAPGAPGVSACIFGSAA